MGVDFIGFKESKDILSMSYSRFGGMRSMLKEYTPEGFRQEFEQWQDTGIIPTTKYPMAWWVFFTHSDCEGMYWCDEGVSNKELASELMKLAVEAIKAPEDERDNISVDTAMEFIGFLLNHDLVMVM